MTAYTYTFLSLRDEQIIEEIPLFGVFAQRVLNGPGQFNGTFQLDQTGKNNADLIAATNPGRTWLVMERISDDGVSTPIWWGMVWSRTYQSQSKTCQLYAWGFEAYPQKQMILTDTKITGTHLQVFSTLWSNMQASANGRNINVNIPIGVPATDINVTVDILATDYKHYITPMDNIANSVIGLDWTIQLTKQNNNTYRKDLVLGYPTLGQPYTGSIAFDYPGAILNYYQTESMAESGTNIFGFGAGEGSEQIVSIFEWSDLINIGFPRWDFEVSMKEVDNETTVTQKTQQEAIKRKPPMPVYVVSLKGNQDPIFGSYNIGDGAQLTIVDPLHPNGTIFNTRIVGWELNPQTADQVEEVKLILPGD